MNYISKTINEHILYCNHLYNFIHFCMAPDKEKFQFLNDDINRQPMKDSYF